MPLIEFHFHRWLAPKAHGVSKRTERVMRRRYIGLLHIVKEPNSMDLKRLSVVINILIWGWEFVLSLTGGFERSEKYPM